MAKGKRFGLYLNADYMDELENLKGTAILIQKEDAVGNPFVQEIRIPSDTQAAVRTGLDVLFSLAKAQRIIDTTQGD